MTKKRTKAMAGLALLAGMVLITGIVWAAATEYAVNGEFYYGGTHIARQWIDDDGVLHLRGITYGLTSTGGNMEMTISGVCNHNYDMVNGDGDFWGKDHTVEVSWGGLTGTFQGSHSGTRTNHTTGQSSHVYQGISGDFEGWKLKFDATWDFSNKTGACTGVLHNPHGE